MIIDFKKYSSIRIGGEVEVEIIDEIKESNKFLIGKANNLLLSPTPPPLAILSKKFNYIKLIEDKLYVGGATPNGRVLSFAKKHNLADFEFLAHLPGTIGGAVKMNAGVKEFEIFNYLSKIKTYKGYIDKRDIEYRYRFSNIKDIIYEAVFKINKGFSQEKLEFLKSLRKNQPSLPSAGSLFKNPKGNFAGRLIEAVGLRGKRVGDMEFSQMHSNFLVNHKNGTFEEAMILINMAKERVFKKFNILLEEEVIIL